jgi:hypothetical protein
MLPTADDLIQHHLLEMRAPLKRRTVFTSAGRSIVSSNGERVVRAPDGTLIRIVELESGGNQIEHGDHLHAVVRPRTIELSTTVKG